MLSYNVTTHPPLGAVPLSVAKRPVVLCTSGLAAAAKSTASTLAKELGASSHALCAHGSVN